MTFTKFDRALKHIHPVLYDHLAAEGEISKLYDGCRMIHEQEETKLLQYPLGYIHIKILESMVYNYDEIMFELL